MIERRVSRDNQMPGMTSVSNTYFLYRFSVVFFFFFFLTACFFVLLCFVLRTERRRERPVHARAVWER